MTMTRAIRDNFLNNENGAISDHLRNHVHLTNCIHLKNHMHRHSPILAERSIMRDLNVLQRSRSLRDPSTSPPSWNSIPAVDSFAKKHEKEGAVNRGRRSLGFDLRREVERFSGTSPLMESAMASRLAATAEVTLDSDSKEAYSDHISADQVLDTRRGMGEEFNKKNRKSYPSGSRERPPQEKKDSRRAHSLVLQTTEPKDRRASGKVNQGQILNFRTLSEQLKESTIDSEDVRFSHLHLNERQEKEKAREDLESSSHSYCNGLNRVKRRKSRGMKRTRVSIGSRDITGHNELSVASNTIAQGSLHPKYSIQKEEEGYDEVEVTRAPKNGCGIPWNWSRIHHRGKTILDMAGRSLSCGLSDSRLRRAEGNAPQIQRDVADMPITSGNSSSSHKSDSEVMPLLIEPPGSQESAENAAARNYSGELGIFANHRMLHDQDSDSVSGAKSGDLQTSTGHRNGRHRSLTQKYMPRTFKDLVGQNLVVKALSNAIFRRKVGLLYVFYGPHGTGKTSCARIFARALNCQSLENPKPCGMCSSCIAYELDKSRNVQELGPVNNYDFESIMDLLDCMVSPHLPSYCRVVIMDDCDTLSPDSWSSILKVIELAPRRVLFVLITTALDRLPHLILSRCQKFFFPKLKDADIIHTMKWIATKEGLEIDKDALKLIASRSDGSLRDAEMTLDQLSLLGQRISVPLVQELVGLICDEKLVNLLDLALSADTVNTVKNLREIMEAGVEPLALMSQLATVITDILAGTYVFTRERLGRKFFRRPSLSKNDTEKLRQALKTLSEAEKQLRVSNDRLTWLTAALLQLAPDQQYLLPSSSADASLTHSPLALNKQGERTTNGTFIDERNDVQDKGRLLRETSTLDDTNPGNANNVMLHSNYDSNKNGTAPLSTSASMEMTGTSGKQNVSKGHREIEEIWLAVLDKIQFDNLKQFMHQEGKLVSVNFVGAPAIQLIFSSHLNKSKAERFKGQIRQAFQSVLGFPVTIEIRSESKKDVKAEAQVPRNLSPFNNGSAQMNGECVSLDNDNGILGSITESHFKRPSKDKAVKGLDSSQARWRPSASHEISKSEIVETVASPIRPNHSTKLGEMGMECMSHKAWAEEAISHKPTLVNNVDSSSFGEQPKRQSIVRSKVSLAHIIQQTEGSTRRNGWSRRKAISIAEKLEQENLRLEPRSRNLLCWKSTRKSHGKLVHFRINRRRPCSLLKLVPCAICPCSKSPR